MGRCVKERKKGQRELKEISERKRERAAISLLCIVFQRSQICVFNLPDCSILLP